MLIAFSAVITRGDTLVLIAQVDGQYDYGIQIDPNHGLVVLTGNRITLTGLSGVTAASGLPDLSFAYATVITSPTAVTIVDTTPFVHDPLPVSHTLAAVRVLSPVSTVGGVS